MKIGCVFIQKEYSTLKREGWFLTINDSPLNILVLCDKLKIDILEYGQIMQSCNALSIIKNNTRHFFFDNKDNAECAIATLKLISKGED